jgi:hypothetical protein
MVLVMEAAMDLASFTSYATAALFWLLVLANMALSTIMFCEDNEGYDVMVREYGVSGANGQLWFFGFLSIGMPILQSGQWLHGSAAWAWGLVVVTVVIWFFIFLPSWLDD